MGRIFKLISIGLVLLELFSSVSSLPYSKYGRSCSDIGCLSSEVCVMAMDSCSYGQRENKECGRYPTCRRSGSTGGSTGPATSHSSYPSNTPENTYPSIPSAPVAPIAPAPEPPRPNYPTHGGGSSYPSASGGGFNNINSRGYMPPGYGGGSSYGGGGSSYGGGGSSYGSGGSSYGGGGSSYGGGGSSYGGGGSYGDRGGYSPMTTKKPKSSSDSFGGFFSGLLSGGISSLIQNALANQGGSTTGTRGGSGGFSSLFGGGSSSGSSGGLGGLFDTRHLIENRNFGSLFNEKSPSSGSTSNTQTSSRGVGYPTQPPTSAYAPSYTGGGSPTSGQSSGASHQTGNTQYGWKL